MADDTEKIALVTGGATGIGAATARRLAERGVRVAILDVNEPGGAALAGEIDGVFLRCDVADFGSFDAALADCVDQLGVPDYAHLNAGIMTVPAGDAFLAIEDVSLEQYRRILGINVDGVFNGVKLLLPRMRERGGAITATASTAGFGELPVDPLYALSKYGLVGFTRSVAAANAGTNLRINAICPGVVDTAIVPDQFKAPEFRMLPPEALAEEIVDLLEAGDNGEIRVRMGGRDAFTVPAQSTTF